MLAPWLAILASGYATLLFASAYRGRTPEPAQAWHELSGRAATLVIAALPFYVAIFATTVALEQMMAGRVSLATRLVAPRLAVAITITLQAIMLLLPPLVLLERRGLRETFAELPSALQHAFLGAVAIAAVSAWIPMPFEAWAAKSAPMVATGWPERVAVVVALRSAAQAVSLALAAGAAALLHRTVLAGREEDAW